MNEGTVHERARRLVDRDRVDGLAPEERQWLDAHLAACETCAAWAEAGQAVLRMLRSVSVAVPPGLATSATVLVRERSAQIRQRRARNLALATACALSWVAGVATAPLVWRLCAWLGSALNLPGVVWQMAFVFWWFVPAAIAALVILVARAHSRTDWNVSDSDFA
jgi:hypothetical protein